ncbi:MAG: hypothetical protein DME21_15450 [Verrucomicrobia bacterium]|nr:MAG: hypothetical protein DME21_15450 [Verrucomicrobiota bacterium]
MCAGRKNRTNNDRIEDRPEWFNRNRGARPPRALPTAPSPLAFRRVRPNRMEFGAGARRTAPEAGALPISLTSCNICGWLLRKIGA